MRWPGLTGLTLAAAAGGFALSRLTRLRKDTSGPPQADVCDPDEGAYPEGRIVIRALDGSAIGPCVAALREAHLTENGSVQHLVENLDYLSLLRSFVEVTYLTVMDLALESFVACDCDNPDCWNKEMDPEARVLQAGRLLLRGAMTFEGAYRDHVDSCKTCTNDGPRARHLVRAQFCRDLADDILTNGDDPDLVLNGAPLQAAFDVVNSFMLTLAHNSDTSIPEQIEHLSEYIAEVTAALA